MTDTMTQRARVHYAADGLMDRIRAALGPIAPDDTPLKPEQLAALDHFHTRGFAATLDLATAANLAPGARVLDVGCGLGGPARVLASRCGAMVEGVDLSAPYVEVGRYLTTRCGLDDRVSLRTGEASSLAAADANFDAVILQHVAMNVADRAGLYREIARVLKPGGCLAAYDVVRGAGEIVYPVPWARTADASHLLSAAETEEAIAAAGLTIALSRDDTPAALLWFAGFAAAGPLAGPTLGLVVGPDFPQLVQNLGRNLQEGRAGILMLIARRPG